MQKHRKIQMEGAEKKRKKLLVREYDIKRDNDFFLGGGGGDFTCCDIA
jgi:hypothetical protein